MEPFIQLTREPLDRDALIAAVSDPTAGGIVVFEGVVRDNARGKQVRYLEYDVYPEMAEQQIRTIIAEAERAGVWNMSRSPIALVVWRLAKPVSLSWLPRHTEPKLSRPAAISLIP